MKKMMSSKPAYTRDIGEAKEDPKEEKGESAKEEKSEVKKEKKMKKTKSKKGLKKVKGGY